MREIKQVEYNELGCFGESDIVCPYCGHHNEPDMEYDADFDEAGECECGKCEKHFMRTPSCSITYESEPIENYYLREIDSYKRMVETYKKDLENCEDKEHKAKFPTLDRGYYEMMVSVHQGELDKFVKEFEQYIAENAECEV